MDTMDIYNFVPKPLTIDKPADFIKQEIVARLRRSIFGSVEEIEIQTGLHPDGTEERLPFLSHPLAMESLTDPPVKRVTIRSEDIASGKHFYMVDENYQDDNPTFENVDGSSITVKDFVIHVHSYLCKHRDTILFFRKTVGFNKYPLPPDAIIGSGSRISFYTPGKHDLFLKRASSSTFSDPLIVSISTFLEGEIAISADAFWKSQRAIADWTAERRAHPAEPWVAPEPRCAYCDFVQEHGGNCDVHGTGE
ncbi:hypothetical protein BKA63DRAFT_520877 [Paraphoma chrysanthemicola]|nr:hypothetical protein BKA63DRAFT_520877 [Paraphoma chrysanthemicola]